MRALLRLVPIAALVACHAPVVRPPVPDPLPGPDPAPVARPGAWVAGHSVEDRPIEVIAFGDGGDVILILASIHGNESAGTPLVEQLALLLDVRPDLVLGRRVVLVPRVNPDGLAHRSRSNAQGVDLNRNLPAANRREARGHGERALSEPETRALHELILALRPARIVSIHQPLGCIDYDGPGEELARSMGASGVLPVRRLGGRPGSLGSWAGETLGIPVITLELPGGASRLERGVLWERYGELLLAAILYRRS